MTTSRALPPGWLRALRVLRRLRPPRLRHRLSAPPGARAMKLLLATNATPVLGAFAIVGTLAAVIWLLPPVRRWTLQWPLFYLLSFGGLLICGAVGLSRTSL